jgi:hypothetical protein
MRALKYAALPATLLLVGTGLVVTRCSKHTEPSLAPSTAPSLPPLPDVDPVVVPPAWASPHPIPSPTRQPPPPVPHPVNGEDPGCIVLRCHGECVVSDVQSERSHTWATWSYCLEDPPNRIGPPLGWRR